MQNGQWLLVPAPGPEMEFMSNRGRGPPSGSMLTSQARPPPPRAVCNAEPGGSVGPEASSSEVEQKLSFCSSHGGRSRRTRVLPAVCCHQVEEGVASECALSEGETS